MRISNRLSGLEAVGRRSREPMEQGSFGANGLPREPGSRGTHRSVDHPSLAPDPKLFYYDRRRMGFRFHNLSVEAAISFEMNISTHGFASKQNHSLPLASKNGRFQSCTFIVDHGE